MTESLAETVVVGLGNPILGDDGVGWRVVEALDAILEDPAITLEQVSVGGLGLMEHLLGHPRALIVDAILGGDDPPGTVRVRPLEQVVTRRASHLDSVHDVPLTGALDAARALGADVPREVLVVGIAVDRTDVFREALSEPVARSVGPAVAAVLQVLERWRRGSVAPTMAMGTS